MAHWEDAGLIPDFDDDDPFADQYDGDQPDPADEAFLAVLKRQYDEAKAKENKS